jgi:hypothetical protein
MMAFGLPTYGHWFAPPQAHAPHARQHGDIMNICDNSLLRAEAFLTSADKP